MKTIFTGLVNRAKSLLGKRRLCKSDATCTNVVLPLVDSTTKTNGLASTTAADGPLHTQVGGSHYKNYAVQPIEYAMLNGLDYCQANVVKYVTRFRDKGGLTDLHKALHNLEILIDYEQRSQSRRPEARF